MNRTRLFHTEWASAIMLVVALSGCSDDGTNPDPAEEFDPAQLASALQAVGDQFLTNNDAVSSLGALGQCYLDAGLSGSLPPGSAHQMLMDAALNALVSESATGVPLRGSAEIPPELLGKTLVYDPVTGTCGPDESRTDAPPNGVRLILYETDATGSLATPLSENGYVDLVDNSVDPNIDVSLTAVVDGQTLIDYSFDAAVSETALDINLNGFLSDGSENLTFSAGADATVTDPDISASVTLSATTTAISISGSADIDVSVGSSLEDISGSGSGSFSITEGGNTTSVTASVDAQGDLTAEVRFNNQLVMVVSGNLDDEEPTVTDGDGNPLPQQEIDALEDLLTAILELFEGLTGLIAVSSALTGLGL